MIQWFKKQSASVRVMILLIVVSLIGIAFNWESVSNDTYEAINSRIEVLMEDTK